MRGAEAILAAGIPLNGLSAEWASLYGMPHIHAHYERDDVDSHARDEGAACAVCGRRAVHAHHCPPKSKGRTFAMRTPRGIFISKPALFALCAECHKAVHGDVGRAPLVTARWEWDTEEGAARFYSGELPSHGVFPNSARLYAYGKWVLEDSRTGSRIEARL